MRSSLLINLQKWHTCSSSRKSDLGSIKRNFLFWSLFTQYVSGHALRCYKVFTFSRRSPTKWLTCSTLRGLLHPTLRSSLMYVLRSASSSISSTSSKSISMSSAPYISWSLSYIHISTRSLLRISAIWWAPYLAVKNFSRFFSSQPFDPPKLTCLFGVPGVFDVQGVALPLRPFLVETSMLDVLEFEPTDEVDEVDPC